MAQISRPGRASPPPWARAGSSSGAAAGPDRMARTSCGISASAETATISTAAPYWVAGTPIAAAIGPTRSAPRGIAPTEPRTS